MGAGVSDQNLWFRQVGNNLEIDVMATSNRLTIDDWFGGAAAASVQSVTAGGLAIDMQVGQLVRAMAAYAADNPGFNPVTAARAPGDPTLQSVIAAAWRH